MMYLAYVVAHVDSPSGSISTSGYILVEADDREQAEIKIANHYEKNWPKQIVERINIGTTVI